MPYPAHCARVVMHASIGGSEEIVTGFWIQFDQSAGPIDVQGVAEELQPFVNGFLGQEAGTMYQTVQWDRLDVYGYDVAGTKATSQGTVPLNTPGTLATAGAALDTCGVMTLLTGAPGRSRRGRMYLPFHPAIANGTTLADALMTARAGHLKTLFNSVNSAEGQIAVSVVSAKNGTSAPVTEIGWDTIPDVQRRRVNQLVAVRQTLAL